jgi:hypothetical protein
VNTGLPVRRPWRWLAALPATGIVLAPFVANRVEPFVLGLPFLLAFITGWVLVTSAVMALIFVLDERADARAIARTNALADHGIDHHA